LTLTLISGAALDVDFSSNEHAGTFVQPSNHARATPVPLARGAANAGNADFEAVFHHEQDAPDRWVAVMPAFRLDGQVAAGFAATSKGCSYFPFSGTTLKTLAAEVEPMTRPSQRFTSTRRRGCRRAWSAS
jgi:hypothetical protein